MNIQEIISDLKQIAAECEKVTSDNVSHRIANIEHGILNIADYLENYCPLGWRPASEVPVFDEFDENKEVIGIWKHQNPSTHFVTIPYDVVDYVCYENGEWLNDGSPVPVRLWCYQPK